MIQEKLLIARFNRGDTTALREIYTLYKDRLTTLAGALLHDQNAAEDAVHDVFTRLIRRQETLSITQNLRQYLTTAVVNSARQYFRCQRKESFTAAEFERVAPVDRGSEPRADAILNEQKNRLVSALAALPYEQREVILLRHYSDFRFRKIASLQSASINTVQARYRYGLDKLRSLLNGELDL